MTATSQAAGTLEIAERRRETESRGPSEGQAGGFKCWSLPIVAIGIALSTAAPAQPEPEGPARPHAVAALVESRLAQGSLPGNRTDGSKLCLAIEGGGMRAVVSAGMLSALEQLGLRDVFDAVYGTSAGAISGAYFLSGQAAFGTSIYYENINNSRMIAARRIVGPGRVVNLGYLLDDVMVREKVLDWRAVLDSPIPLNVVVTSIDRRRAEVLEGFSSRYELWEAMRASTRVPVIAGPPVEICGDRYIDGNVYAAIPLDPAVADLCSHVLVLQSWPGGLERHAPGPLRRWAVRRYLKRFDPELAEKYGRGPPAYDETMAAIRLGSASGDGPPYVLGVTVEETMALSTFEKRRDRLIAGASDGFDALMRTFGHLGADSASPFRDQEPSARPRPPASTPPRG